MEVVRLRGDDLPLDVGDADLGVALAILALVLVFVLFGIPVLLFLVAVAVAVLSLVLRIVFGRPWLVEAKSARGELQWRVRGTRGSRRAMHEIAAAVRRGDRSFSPPYAERLLLEAPRSTGDGRSNVRVLPPRE